MNGGVVLAFSWRCADGHIVNWWGWPGQSSIDDKRFVHHEWGKFVIGIDLRAHEAQIQFNQPPEWRTIKFEEIADESCRYALEAVADTHNPAFAAELLMRVIGRDDLAELIARGEQKSAAQEPS